MVYCRKHSRASNENTNDDIEPDEVRLKTTLKRLLVIGTLLHAVKPLMETGGAMMRFVLGVAMRLVIMASGSDGWAF